MDHSRREAIYGLSSAMLALAGCSVPGAKSASPTETTEQETAVDVRVINNTSTEQSISITVSADSSVIVQETVIVQSGEATVVEAGIRQQGTYELSVEGNGMSDTGSVTLGEYHIEYGRNFRVEVRPDSISIGVYE
ncbi:hypothetical protein GCM10009030_23930 [Haloarcula pellucida]|uniref:Uncharacterized protein n=1 Tax=Haloarcula pellucida TaxID=1427151 RepID=A0A830GNT1_9EURY|nr:hypothetical protein GCM10009030_23930 [Halomicroarcula pellucida]